MKKIICTSFIILAILFTFSLSVFATVQTAQSSLEDIIQSETSIDLNQLDMTQVLQAYDELTEKYSNQDLADMLEANKEELKQYGIDESAISAGADVLRSVDTNEFKDILKNDIDLNAIQEQLSQGVSPETIFYNLQEEMTPADRLALLSKILWSSYIVKAIVITSLIIFLYTILLRWIIYRKAGRHGFAAIIPIYNQITMLKVCKLSPWWLLLIFVPIIGWLILGIIGIVMRFKLASSFNKGFGFGLGLLFLGLIFESILAFSSSIKYVKDEE